MQRSQACPDERAVPHRAVAAVVHKRDGDLDLEEPVRDREAPERERGLLHDRVPLQCERDDEERDRERVPHERPRRVLWVDALCLEVSRDTLFPVVLSAPELNEREKTRTALSVRLNSSGGGNAGTALPTSVPTRNLLSVRSSAGPCAVSNSGVTSLPAPMRMIARPPGCRAANFVRL